MNTISRFTKIPRPAVISPARKAIGSALLYVVMCSAYIVYSGRLAARAAGTSQQLHALETIKGIAFIVVTGVLFFVISQLQWSRIRRKEDTIIAMGKTILQEERKIAAAMFAATVAHDLNTLLLALSGLIEGLKGREGADPFLLEMREGIETGMDKLSHLSERLKSAVSGAMPDKEEEVDVKEAIRELVFEMREHPDVRSCRISMSDVAPLTLVLNRTLFEEAVMNLLLNAAQATGPRGQIVVRLTAEQDAFILAIHDNGPGVPNNLVKDIFEPCFTTKPGGTGIGLLGVTVFAASCGAEIFVDRSPLGGALFQLRIPIQNQIA